MQELTREAKRIEIRAWMHISDAKSKSKSDREAIIFLARRLAVIDISLEEKKLTGEITEWVNKKLADLDGE